ncbi:MAG: LacI family transcriptional regulator, partial [Clostridia bacterium]|nr:LacI family transcriptional regulator [Clostridia bacterium]
VFICANDFVAIDLLQILRQLKISVPDDVWLCGFDDSPESRIVTPPLTTIHIHCEIMGISAVQLLLSRIKEPSLNYRTTYTETTLVYRESTGD